MAPKKRKKKRTDTQRLKWVMENPGRVVCWMGRWEYTDAHGEVIQLPLATMREAIDGAMDSGELQI